MAAQKALLTFERNLFAGRKGARSKSCRAPGNLLDPGAGWSMSQPQELDWDYVHEVAISCG
jgi:hypothetical protein